MYLKDLEVCGIGGIEDWQSAAEYLMVGASLVQICTAAMWHGFPLGKQLKKGLIRFREGKGYSALSEFRGVSLRSIDYRQEVDSIRGLPLFDREKCILCKRCIQACKDAAYDALLLEDSQMQVNSDKCECCGLCGVVCKEGAISYGRAV